MMSRKSTGFHVRVKRFTHLDQVAYIPNHANGDIDHKDVEFGFVVSQATDDTVFVRYWRKGEEGRALRTTSCSEATPVECLKLYQSAMAGEVLRAWSGVK